MLAEIIKNKIVNININIFRSVLLVFLLLSFSLLTSYAQTLPPTVTNSIPATSTTNTPCLSTSVSDGLGNISGGQAADCIGDTNVGTFNSTTGVITPSSQVSNTKTPCSNVAGLAPSVGCNIGYFILKIVLEIVGRLTQLSAGIFDSAISGYVLNIKTLFLEGGQSGQDKAWIYESWAVIRDLTNIIMFFSAMYVGARYIMGSEELDFRKSLIKIVIFAVFVNFSFSMSKYMIDMSNFLSLSVRGGITGYDASRGISDIIMEYTGISKAVIDVGNFNKGTFAGYSEFTTMFLAIVFLASAFFVFAYCSIMIFVRAIILLTCVIFSPFMFLTTTFKSMEKINQMWRDNFIGQLLFGPVLMLGLWLSIGFLQSAGTRNTEIGADIGTTSLMVLSIVSLFLAVFAASKVSAGLGGAIGSMVGGAIKNVGLGVATGGAGLALRSTVGRAGAAMANSKWVKGTNSEHGSVRKFGANLFTKAGNAGANASIGGSKSTNDKLKIAKEKMMTDQNTYIENNRSKIKETGMSDQMYQARGDEEKTKVARAMHENRVQAGGDKSKWKSEEQVKKELGLVKEEVQKRKIGLSYRNDRVDVEKELVQKKLEIEKNAKENNFSDLRKDRLLRVEEGRTSQKLDELEELSKNTTTAKLIQKTKDISNDVVLTAKEIIDIPKAAAQGVKNMTSSAVEAIKYDIGQDFRAGSTAPSFRSKTISGKSATAKPKPEVNANPLPGQGPAASAAAKAANDMMGGSSVEIVTKDNDLTKL